MKPEIKQRIKCLLTNGTLVEGIIENWTDEEVVLLSLDGESLLILPQPQRDIMLIKIVLDDKEKIKPVEKPKPKLPQSELHKQFEEVLALPSDTPGRIETLAELRKQLTEADKAIVARKLKEHHIGNTRLTEYTNPYAPRKVKR